jgi:multimeric flavodoxin WrbA
VRAIVLHGSPRRGGDSDTLASAFLDGLTQTRPWEIEHFYTNELRIRPCQGCLQCLGDHRCAIHDDMDAIYEGFTAARVVMFATPMYWGYMTAQLKAVMDRLEALAGEPFRGKIFVVLITYHHHCQSTVAFFERVCPGFGVELHTQTCHTLDETARRAIPISECFEELSRARQLGIRLSA